MTETVTLTFGADLQNVALARSTAAAMAARADLTVDRLEDVRLAVDEAVTEAISSATEGSEIAVAFSIAGDTLGVVVTSTTGRAEVPSPTSFGWTVLSALVDSAEAALVDGRMTIGLQISRTSDEA